MKLIDLHVHSNISDGTLTPAEVATLAKNNGLTAIALTDHDTIDGVQECMAAAQMLDLEVVPGIELSANYHGKEIHILGYYINCDHPTLSGTLTTLIEDRHARNIEMLEKLRQAGCEIALSDLSSNQDGEVLTRAHFARALMQKGYIGSIEEAFEKYIGAGQIAYVPKHSLEYTECIDLIHNAGGICVLAHPMIYKFTDRSIKDVILDLKQHGLNGVEVIYPKHSAEETQMLTDLCHEQNLCITGGSDFHGMNKPNLSLGSGYGDLQVPYALLETLKSNQ